MFSLEIRGESGKNTQRQRHVTFFIVTWVQKIYFAVTARNVARCRTHVVSITSGHRLASEKEKENPILLSPVKSISIVNVHICELLFRFTEFLFLEEREGSEKTLDDKRNDDGKLKKYTQFCSIFYTNRVNQSNSEKMIEEKESSLYHLLHFIRQIESA